MTTQREEQIVETLSKRVRVLSITQVAREWWPDAADGEGLAKRFLNRLAARGRVRMLRLFARPELIPTEPLVTWQPGLPVPDFGALAYQLRRRRTGPAVETACVISAFGRPPRPTDTTHDLHLAAVYLLMRRELPTRAATWQFEDSLQKRGEKLPDARVRDGKKWTVIECGGEYAPHRLESDHKYCAERAWGYEIW